MPGPVIFFLKMIFLAHVDSRMVLGVLAFLVGTYLFGFIGFISALLRKRGAALLFSVLGFLAGLVLLAEDTSRDAVIIILPGVGMSLLGLIIPPLQTPRPASPQKSDQTPAAIDHL